MAHSSIAFISTCWLGKLAQQREPPADYVAFAEFMEQMLPHCRVFMSAYPGTQGEDSQKVLQAFIDHFMTPSPDNPIPNFRRYAHKGHGQPYPVWFLKCFCNFLKEHYAAAGKATEVPLLPPRDAVNPLLLDRGERLEWFASAEIWVEAIASVLGFYLYIVHILTAKAHFLNKALFKDRNFVLSTIMFFAFGFILLPTLALTSPMLEQLLNYPVDTTGYMTIPRGGAIPPLLKQNCVTGRSANSRWAGR